MAGMLGSLKNIKNTDLCVTLLKSIEVLMVNK